MITTTPNMFNNIVNRCTSHSYPLIYFGTCHRGKKCIGRTEKRSKKIKGQSQRLLSATEILQLSTTETFSKV